MLNSLSGMASKKLAIVGACLFILISNAEANGWQWWHGISVAIVAFGYCVAQAFDDGMTSHGLGVIESEQKKSDEDAEKDDLKKL